MKVMTKLSTLVVMAVLMLASVAAVHVPIAMAVSVQSPTANGVYGMTAVLHQAGTTQDSHVNGILDPRIKLVKGDQGMTVSVLVPKGATASYGASGDMIADVAIESGDTFVSGKRTRLDCGVEYSELPVADVADVQKLAFGLKGASYHGDSERKDYDTYQVADLVFSDMTDWWAGYDAQAPVGLEDGVYSVSVETRQAGTDASTGLPSLVKPLMGGETFGETMWIAVENGNYTATVGTHKVNGVYMDNFRYCRLAGGDVSAAMDERNLAKARTLTRHRNDDGSMYTDADHGTYSDLISLKLPGKGRDPYVFMRMEVYASAMPFPALVNDGVWGILMDWSTLKRATLPDTAALKSAVEQAKRLADSESAEQANAGASDNWKRFGYRLGAAQDALGTSFTLGQSQIDKALDALKAAQGKLTVPYALAKELGLLKTQVLSVVKSAIFTTIGAKNGTFALGASSNAKGAKLSYQTSNSKVVQVDASGKVTPKAPGTATVTVTSTANGYENATAAVSIKVSLGKAALTKKTKSTKKGKIAAAWKRVAGAQGYELKVGKKTYMVKGAKALGKTVKASKGKKVKVSVRAWSKAGGTLVHGAWSKAKTVKVK